jgi:hypothetical protein
LNIRRIISLIACGLIAISLVGCGDTYELQSISVEPTHPNVVGLGGTQRLVVTAHYSNNKTFDVTRKATYTITSPGTAFTSLASITIDANGLIELVGPACTWTQTGTAPNYEYGTVPYNLNVAFEGKTVQGFISATSITGCYSPDTPPPTN